ncbi:MAG TPA: YihY/virulence factor BrkB family protein [Solirubrobacteraceae bacterium]|nr:YihY/virulence factor BrkB family protein [Solirubrobacteraceae bacterium]
MAEPRLRRAGRRVVQLADRAFTEFFRDGCPQRAAAISFYALFSLFPLAILAVAIMGLVINDAEARTRVANFVLDNLPLSEARARRDLEVLLLNVTRNVAGFGIFGFVVLMFTASAVMGAIRHALNAAFAVDDPRPPAQAKALDLVLVIAFGAVLTLSLALTIGERLTESLGEAVDELIPGAGGAIVRVVVELGHLFPLLMAFATFAALFRLVPARCPRLRDTWPGVLIAAVGYELAKNGFAIYLANFANYSAVYASLATVIAFLVFVWVASNVALLGAEAAAQWPTVRSGALDGDEGEPFLERAKGLLKGLFVRTS